MSNLTRQMKIGSSIIGVTVAAYASPALAQVTSNENETVVVTGTSIRGIAPVGSSLITVGSQDIDNMGAQNVTQVMADMPSIEAFGTPGRAAASASNGNPGTAIYIHQLGANGSNSTLILMDGQRFPWSGDTNYFVDPNNIPTPMIERVEVDAEGASAVYGSDAVAGVVNFITSKSFDGIQFKAQASDAKSLSSFQASILAGTSWSDGSVVGAIDFANEGQLRNTARPWTNPLAQPAEAAAAGLSGAGATNFGNFNCDPATVQPNGSGNIYLTALGTTNVPNNAANFNCSNWAYGAILPHDVRENAMIKVTQNVGSRFTINADMLVSQRNSQQIQSRGALTATAFGSGPQANPFFVPPPGSTATAQTIRYDFDQLLGPGALSIGGSNLFYGSTNIIYNITDDWEVDFLGLGGLSQTYAGENVGTVNSGQALLALNGTTQTSGKTTTTSIPGYNAITLNLPLTTDNALDVWDPASSNKTSAAVRQGLTDNQNINYGDYYLENMRLTTQGKLFSTAAGPVKVAFGVEMLNTQIYEYGTKPENNAGASVGSQAYRYNFGRKDFAEFVETDIPLVGPDMNIPLVRKFEVDLALRHDDYSDFGPTTNPKASFNWDVIDSLRLRGNISTSFVAPPLNLVGGKAGLANFSSVGGSTQSGSIPVSFYPAVTQFGIPNCTASSQSCSIASLQGISSSVGDPTAIAQKGRGWSVGLDFAPEFLPGFTSAVTLWNTSLIGGMTAPQFSARVTTASLVHDLTLYPSCATPAQVAAFAAQAPQSSVFPACVQFTFLSDTSNYLTFYAQGVDLTASYTFDTDFGTVRIDDNLTQMTKFDEGFAYKIPPTPSQLFSALGTDGFASQFPSVATQMRGHFGWTYMDFLADFYVNFTSAYKNVNGSAVVVPVPNAAGVYSGVGGDHVNANTTFDLHMAYNFNGGVLGDDQISLEMQNLANSRPPYFNAANAYDNLVANPIGRMFTLGLAAKM